MRAMTLAAAVAATMISGSAYAACGTKDLSGEWLIDVAARCGVDTCRSLCKGKFNAAGKFKSKSCFVAEGYKDNFTMSVKMKADCSFAGNAVLKRTTSSGTSSTTNTIEGTLGSFGGSFISVSGWKGSTGNYLYGRVDGMRVGN